MQTLKLNLSLESYLASPLQGDTFFGQLCWAWVHLFGEDALTELLAKYDTQPFAVVSDAFPAGFLPIPKVPQQLLTTEELDPKERKAFKSKKWVSLATTAKPVAQWLKEALTEQEVLQSAGATANNLWHTHEQMHNSINRLTGTTGEGGFAPYGVATFWAAPNLTWDIYLSFNPNLASKEALLQAVEYIGTSGYGKDASLGAGKFKLLSSAAANLPHANQANALFTLAPSAPQGLAVKAEGCFYQPFTRFGRHGNWPVLVNPYKNPILLAASASIFTPEQLEEVSYFGQALGGKGEISRTLPATVHQGYAPVLRVVIDI